MYYRNNLAAPAIAAVLAFGAAIGLPALSSAHTIPDGTGNAVDFTHSAGETAPVNQSPLVTVGPGTSIETAGGPFGLPLGSGSWCTVGAVGTDKLGNYVAITAGHCDTAPGTREPVRLRDSVYGRGATIGYFATETSFPQGAKQFPVDSRLDYSVIKLDPTVVRLTNTAPDGAVFDRLNLQEPRPGEQMCKYGQVSGLTCAPIVSFSHNTIHSSDVIIPGDSGGAVLINGGFAGINSAIVTSLPFAQFTSIIGVLQDIAKKGPHAVGIGFTPWPGDAQRSNTR